MAYRNSLILRGISHVIFSREPRAFQEPSSVMNHVLFSNRTVSKCPRRVQKINQSLNSYVDEKTEYKIKKKISKT